MPESFQENCSLNKFLKDHKKRKLVVAQENLLLMELRRAYCIVE
jgi:hypothetical protein